MGYSLKTTGIPAAYNIKACLVVDQTGPNIVDLVTANAISVDSGVTIGTGSWNGATRRFFSTTGSGFTPKTVRWTSVPTISLTTGFSLYAGINSINSRTGTPVFLVAVNASSNGAVAKNLSAEQKFGNDFSAHDIFVGSSTYSDSQKLSVTLKGIANGAQSGRQGNEGSALSSLGSSTDGGFMSSSWVPDIICGQDGQNWLAADIYCLLLIEGSLADADGDALHTDWFSALIATGGTLLSDNGVSLANISKLDSIAIASIKSANGLTTGN